MLADLHIHSKYSSHALYINKPHIVEKLAQKYSPNSIFSEQPNLLSKIIIDGTSKIETILKLANTRGIKCIAITDHNTTVGSQKAMELASKYDIIVIPAMELSTDTGELLCYGITQKIEKGLPIKEAIAQVHNQGGIVVVPHPFNPKHPNVDFARLDEEVIRSLNVDGIEVFNTFKGKVDEYFVNLARELNIGITGGSDAHINYQIGKGLTVIPDSCKTYKDVIKAIKNGNTNVKGRRINFLRVGIDLLWCNTLGRVFINRGWE